ncbi:MAG: ABC transporter permease [Truepera sp.]|nr:ABC transporter permease [Truepera sp.]
MRRQNILIVNSLPLLTFIALGLAGPLLIRYSPFELNVADRLKAPLSRLSDGTIAWFGTDQLGRELLPQVVEGSRISLLVGFASVLSASLIGLVLGVVAGYLGGRIDTIIMRLVDLQLTFPPLFTAIVIAGFLKPSLVNIIIAITWTRWASFTRIIRGLVIDIKEEVFLESAQALGGTTLHILRRHVVPFTLSTLLVVSTTVLGEAILAEASLSFLGLGVPKPAASWGTIISEGRDYLSSAWWISTLPGLVMLLCVLSAALFGDTLRDHLDPKKRT